MQDEHSEQYIQIHRLYYRLNTQLQDRLTVENFLTKVS